MKKDPNKGYIALLGWSLSAVETAEDGCRRYVVMAPSWAGNYCKRHSVPYVRWEFGRLDGRSMGVAEELRGGGKLVRGKKRGNKSGGGEEGGGGEERRGE
jgi:hypothetical protein